MTDHKRRGRPPGPPKEPKPPAKMGRPSVWPPEMQPTAVCTRKVPLLFNELLESDDFRNEFVKLLIDFRNRKK